MSSSIVINKNPIKKKNTLVKNRSRNNSGSSFKSFFGKVGNQLSRLGKALMFPIAMLPIAAILMRIGLAIPAHDSHGQLAAGATAFTAFVSGLLAAAGNAVFNNLAMLFAIGIAFGLSKDSRGESAIVAFFCMSFLMLAMGSGAGHADLVKAIYGGLNIGQAGHPGFDGVFNTYDPSGKLIKSSYDAILANNVLNGIIIGGLVAFIYNKFKSVEMPRILAFFSGRRFVPVVAILSSMIFVLIWAVIFPWIGYGIYKLSELLNTARGNRFSNAGIMFGYGFLNRLLLPFGLHSVINTLFWFTFGTEKTASGATVYGDINGFLQGRAAGNTSGTFQSGFFVIMMFGLPAIVAAIWVTAKKSERIKVVGLLGGAALVSFFTGITEPIEFAFLYAAPLLFFIHAVLTGVFGFITGLMGIQLGFGFSAGLIDYVLSIPKSLAIIHANKTGISAVLANPGWIIILGAICAGTYFYVAKFAILKWDIATPGRKNNLIFEQPTEGTTTAIKSDNSLVNKYTARSQLIVQGVGGPKNIQTIEWCATRLRFILKDRALMNDTMLKQAGSNGNINVGGNGLQVIMGPLVEQFGDNINYILTNAIPYAPTKNTTIKKAVKKAVVKKTKAIKPFTVKSPVKGTIVSLSKVKDPAFAQKIIGDGIAIMPSDGKFYAPISGKLDVVFDTGHAYGITNDEGVTVLVHIGIDTVNSKSNAFKSYVKQGDKIEQGNLLVEVDIEKLKKEGFDIITPVIVPISEKKYKLKIPKKTGATSRINNLFTVTNE